MFSKRELVTCEEMEGRKSPGESISLGTDVAYLEAMVSQVDPCSKDVLIFDKTKSFESDICFLKLNPLHYIGQHRPFFSYDCVDSLYEGALVIETQHTSCDVKYWFADYLKLEKERQKVYFSDQKRSWILSELTHLSLLDQFLARHYPGVKRFSLDGAESLVVAILDFVHYLANQGSHALVMGATHRGRLAILHRIFQKTLSEIRSFFGPDYDDPSLVQGDVKYHLGHKVRRFWGTNSIDLHLLSNPSHLGFIAPVVLGYARGLSKALPLIIHGDAAFSGQGIIYETFQLSQMEAYHAGGAIHVIIDNQIGFTATPEQTRSTRWASDGVRGFGCPVLHVNGNEVEAVIECFHLAYEYRKRFSKDIIINIICYRRYGHNEGDDPTLTHPLLYKEIGEENGLLAFYSKKIKKKIDITNFYKENDEEWCCRDIQKYKTVGDESKKVSFSKESALDFLKVLTQIPFSFSIHEKLQKILNLKISRFESLGLFDFSTAEWLAFAFLLKEGVSVRLTGQDVERGTFSTRHGIWVDQKTGKKYSPFSSLEVSYASTDLKCDIINSPLSEVGCLGFEFGYSLVSNQTLVIWEAQFGDFINVAQVIVDQFIASCESKWGESSNLVLLLPHGYEGQGPEHSSARLERFLRDSANYNWRLFNCVRPITYLKILYQQGMSHEKKPLIIFSPKSLHRHQSAFSRFPSSCDPWVDEAFFEIGGGERPRLVIVCTGRLYYALLKKWEEEPCLKEQVVILCFERLFPFSEKELRDVIKKYEGALWRWVQEEPRNMGAWSYMREHLGDLLVKFHIDLECVSRPCSSSPATGFYKRHLDEERIIIDGVFR